MNKSDLKKSLSAKLNMTEKQTGQAIDFIFESFSDALTNGDRIEIRGFGSFSVKDYDSYTGKNPRTGEKIHIKAKKLPVFKVGKALKEKVNLIKSSNVR